MNRSLGGLRLNKSKNYKQQPDYLGRLLITRDTLNCIVDESKNTSNRLIEVTLAGWNNEKRHKSGYLDTYLTIEVRALSNRDKRYLKPSIEEEPLNNLEKFFR